MSEDHSFKSNPNLKQVGMKINYTKEMIMEISRCSEDPIYFIEKYVKVLTLDYGEIPFKLYDYQKKFIKEIHNNRFNIARWARQMGKSTTCGAYFVWCSIFKDSQFIAIMANKVDTAIEIIYRVKQMYESVPVWLQQGVKTWNVKSFTLENGSRVQASATTASAIRGKTVNVLFIDEVAHIPKKLWDQFYLSSYPTITSGETTKLIFVSTPKGLNHFYDFYIGAPENGFVTSDATWELHPNRGKEWLSNILTKFTKEEFAQEFECNFLGSSYSLINPGTLTSLKHEEPLRIAENLWIFEEPVPNAQYIITADVSEGLGFDHSAFHVLRLNDIKNGQLEEVASFQDNRTDPIQYAAILFRIGMYYNTAHVLVESNDIGKTVIRYLKIDLEYPNVVRTKHEIDPARPSADKSRDFGLRVTKRTKRIGCINLKIFIESHKFKIKCKRTIEEFKHFVRPPEVAEKDGSFSADSGYNDDLIMPLVNLSFLFSTQAFTNMFETTSLIEMFKETIVNSSIDTSLNDLHLPIFNIPERTHYFNPVGVRLGQIRELELGERRWFTSN